MHRSFADWYTQVQDIDGPTLKLRWKAVEAAHAALSTEQVPSLLRVFYSRPQADQAKESLRSAAKTADDLFLMDRDDAELSVLAGAVIAHAVNQEGNNLADSLALGVVCMEAEGLRQVGRMQGVVSDVWKYIGAEAVRIRKAEQDSFPKIQTPDLTTAIKSLKAHSECAALAEGVELAFRALTKALDDHSQMLEGAVVSLQRREETDVLWWLFGGCSLDSTLGFSDMSTGEACFLGARDLSKLTNLLPGPVAARAFLKKMLDSTKSGSSVKLTLKEGVDEFYQRSTNWKVPATTDAVADCCPMLFGLHKCVESGGGAWTDAFHHQTGINAGAEMDAVALASQIYHELLFLRSIDHEVDQ